MWHGWQRLHCSVHSLELCSIQGGCWRMCETDVMLGLSYSLILGPVHECNYLCSLRCDLLPINCAVQHRTMRATVLSHRTRKHLGIHTHSSGTAFGKMLPSQYGGTKPALLSLGSPSMPYSQIYRTVQRDAAGVLAFIAGALFVLGLKVAGVF